MPKNTDRSETRRSGRGTVYQMPDGRWRGAITYGYNEKGNPKRYTVTKRNEKDAATALNIIIGKLHLGIPVTEEKISVGEFLDHWLKDHVTPDRSPKTTRFYRQMCELYIKPVIGHLPLAKLTPMQVQGLFRSLQSKEQPLSPQSVRHVRAVLRTALTRAFKWGMLRENPVLKTDPPKMEHKEAVFLTVDEAAALKEEAADHFMGSLIILALNTGLRLGEATGLTWNDIDLDAKAIVVRKQLQRVDGKFMLRDVKTKTSRRTLPLTGEAVAALQSQKANQLMWSTEEGEGFNPLGLAFTTAKGKPLDQKHVDEHLKKLAKEAGIEKTISFHKLRHSTATHLVANGASLQVVKELLGHSQLSITADLYAHALPAAHRSAMDLLEGVFNKRDEKAS